MTVISDLQIDKERITQYSRSAGEPDWMLELRLAALDQAAQLDLPKVEKTKIDKWNFTQFQPFVQVDQVSEIDDLPISVKEWMGEGNKHVLVQHNGSMIYRQLGSELAEQGVIFTDLQTALREHPEKVEKFFMKSGVNINENKLIALNTALWSGGVFLYVPKNVTVEEPFVAMFTITGEGSGMVPHVIIVAEENSKVTYVEHRTSDEGSHVHNGITEIFAGAGSKVIFAGVNSFAKETVDYTYRIGRVGRDARIEWALGETGDGFAVSENYTLLKEDGASVDSKMVCIGTDEQKGNFTTRAVHFGKHTESQILSKGVLLDQAAQVFNGYTKIEKGAVRSSGEQTERILMLSGKARGDANPILLIDEFDVDRCGHAASVGKIDEMQLFYLMSRGLSRSEAENLIIRGFLNPVVSEIPHESVQNRLKEAIERKLGR
jgi:Fe-S cluster assembly protein SufD